MHVSLQCALGMMTGIGLTSLSPALLPLWSFPFAFLLCLQFRRSMAGGFLIAALMGAYCLSYVDQQQAQIEHEHRTQLDDREPEILHGVVEGMPQTWPGRQQLRLRTSGARILLTVFESDKQLAPLRPGQEIQVLARLGRPIGLRGEGAASKRNQVMAQGAQLVASAKAEDVTVVMAHHSLWQWPVQAHRWGVERLQAGDADKADGQAVLTALTTGERSGMSESLSQAIRAAGVAHLLAVSGMHLGAVVALVFFVILRLWSLSPWRQVVEPRTAAAATALVGALFFTALTGARPSTSRALLVAILMLLGMMIDKRMSLLHALAWAASALLLFRPVLLWDPGFQLSFAATTALAIAFRPSALGPTTPLRFDASATTRWARLRQAFWALFRASLWATVATMPISMYHFGEVSWIGLATNLVAVPLVTLLILPAALAGLLLSSLWPSAGALLLQLPLTLSQLLVDACYLVESWVPLQVRAPLSSWELVAWGIAVLAWLHQRLPRRVRWVLFLGALVFMTISRLWAGPIAASTRDSLRVTFVEVGQGDAAVVEVPGGEVWLIDGGGLPFVGPVPGGSRQHVAETPARQALLPYLRHRRIDKIDLVVVSHPHPDHYIGLQAVARTMPIEELWSAHSTASGTKKGSKRKGPYERWLARLAWTGTRVLSPSLGEARVSHGASLHVLWPNYAEPGQMALLSAPDPILSVNDNSLVVRLDFAGRRILFTGDIEAEAEELLRLTQAHALRADVVKVPHHGSPTSSTEEFVAATSARIAVISCGLANHFGFPGKEVLARWQAQADYVFRTDQVGSVTLRIAADGQIEAETVSPF